LWLFAAVTAATWLQTPALAGIKHDDINVGVDPATGRLGLLWSGATVELPELSGPLLFGFGLDEPGVFTIENPFGGLEPLSPGAILQLEVIAFDDALRGWRPGFAGTFENPGDTWDIGAAPVDVHPFWQINALDSGYVPPPGQTEWNATFRILDIGSTGYLPSDPLTVTFSPEPGSVALLAFGGVLVASRFRRR